MKLWGVTVPAAGEGLSVASTIHLTGKRRRPRYLSRTISTRKELIPSPFELSSTCDAAFHTNRLSVGRWSMIVGCSRISISQLVASRMYEDVQFERVSESDFFV